MKRYLLLLLSCIASAQTFDGINVPVNRTVTLTPDEAAFTILVFADLNSTQQQVKQTLQNAGLPNPTVVATGLGQYSNRVGVGAVQMLYSAAVTVAVGSAIDVAKGLEALRTKPPAPLQGLQYSVAYNPSQAAVDTMRQTVMPQLLDEARKKAQTLAAVAGVKVGAIRSVSDSVAIGGIGTSAYLLAGDFSQIVTGYFGNLPYLPSSTQYTFSVNVVFATAR